jgi:hypothetical protein
MHAPKTLHALASVPAPARVCGHCDGFALVHISTGNRRPDGTLPTLAAACPACSGTGTRLASAGR